MNNKKKALTAISIGALAVIVFMCWQLFEQIVLISIDDAMYAGFTQHGLTFFVEKNIWHYMNFNGRIFVHLIMQLMVFFEEHLYAILFPVFVTVGTFMLTKVAKPDWGLYKRLFASVLVMILFWGLDYSYFTNITWIASGMNYVFPLFVVAIFYFLFLKHRHNTKAMWWLLPFAFLCGATTEQYGMYTVGLITMTYVFDFIDNKKIDKRGFAYLGLTIVGLLTILLAPPTLNRFAEKTGIAENISFIDGFLNNWDYLGGALAVRIAPLVFMSLMAWFACCKMVAIDESGNKMKSWRYSPLLILGFPFSIITYGCYMIGNYTVPAIIALVYMTILITTMLMKKETRIYGTILLCGFGTWFMMSVTSVLGIRTCIPFVLSCIIVIAIMFIDTLALANKKVVSGLILVVLLLSCLLGYYDYYENYKKSSVNCQELYDQMISSGETGYIKFNWDKTYSMADGPIYRYATLTDGYPLIYFQDKFGIPDNVKYFISSDKYEVANVCYNDIYSQTPAVIQDGVVFVPLHVMYCELAQNDNISIKVLVDTKTDKHYISVEGKELVCDGSDFLLIGNATLANIDVVCEQFNLEYNFDLVENTYKFTDATS